MKNLIDDYLEALVANDPTRLNWADDLRHTENNVLLAPGDGAWNTAVEVARCEIRLGASAGAAAGTAAGAFGILREGTVWSPFCLRVGSNASGQISEVELIVSRPQEKGLLFCSAALQPRSEFAQSPSAVALASEAEMIALVDGYFDTLQRNDGRIHTVFHPACRRRENGVWTTQNSDPNSPPTLQMDCEESFKLGFFRFNDRVRDRRYPLIDRRQGLVLAAAFIDHSGKLKHYELTDGTAVTSLYQRPHSLSMLELFQIRDGAITAIEAVFHNVPYGMPSAWRVADA